MSALNVDVDHGVELGRTPSGPQTRQNRRHRL